MPCKGEMHVGPYPPWLANKFFFYLWDLYYLKNMFCYLELHSPNLCFILKAKEMFKCIFKLGPIQTCHQNSTFYPFHPLVDKKWLKNSHLQMPLSFFFPISRCPYSPSSPSAGSAAVCFLCLSSANFLFV